MRIYILPVEKEPQPKIRPWPPHSVGFTMEIDFLNFLNQSNLLTDDPDDADWHYLPINWTFWLLNHNYGRLGREEMQDYINKVVIDSSRTFTVSEAGGTPANFDVGEMKIFSANQMTSGETPIPLLSLPHKLPYPFPEKKWLASFVGSMKWPTRVEMREVLKNRKDILIVERRKGEEFFVDTIMSSYVSLCPRGSADSSYRFYESMQLGVCPIMINEVDFRPFPGKIPWDDCSFFVDSPAKVPQILSQASRRELLLKGSKAKIYWELLSNYGWCRLLLDYL